tara:strand:+ start:384 stop:614 length:231 start_codon:yes stop_codon:yes gene_type:complete
MFGDISTIDARLTELEQEKQQLMSLREELQKSKLPRPFQLHSLRNKKLRFSEFCFAGAPIFFPIAGKTNKDEVVIP